MQTLTLREIQLCELEMLVEFDKICRENNLKYSLSGGTLLGAVRHKGFIPWDDDIDVIMSRPDYEKFRNIFREKADVKKFDLADDRGDGAEYPFLKILSKTVKIEKSGFNEVNNLWIDIFPVDGYPSDRQKSLNLIKKAQFYKKTVLVSKYESLSQYRGKHSKLTLLMGRVFAKMYGVRRALKNSLKLALKHPYDSSEYVGVVTWGTYGIGERLLKSKYESLTELEFEGHRFYCVAYYDEYLRGLYGDYMQLPPEEKRITHHIQAYRVENG